MTILMEHTFDTKKPKIKASNSFSQSIPSNSDKEELERRLTLVENQIIWLEKIRKTLKHQLYDLD
ncbi:MAG: hypothetical protein ACTSVK_18010 [Promethearchaeota archaeon]